MHLSYRRSYKQRRRMRNIIVFIIIAIVFVVASFFVMYLRSLDFGSKGRQSAVLERIVLTPLNLKHFRMVKVSSHENFNEPGVDHNLEVVHGDNHYDETYYTLFDKAVTDDYFSDALFIGDSRTEGFFMYTGIQNIEAYYSKGLNIEDIYKDKIVKLDGKKLTVLEALEKKQYGKIYIMFGVNELGWAFDYLFQEQYAKLVDDIIALQPNAIIYVQNILPISAKRSATDKIYNNDNVNHFNDLIVEFCQARPQVVYLDVASSVKDETGALPEGASTDGVHCNKDYCMMWYNYLKTNTFTKNAE